jgi:hypothetical protein
MDRLNAVLQKIDRFNANDPHRELVDGVTKPRELVYSERLTKWVWRLDPKPSEALLIAARGQHIGRWTIPRDSYPPNRGGYLLWRQALKAFHARKVAELMQEAGYESEFIEKVRAIVYKDNIKGDADTQTIEDALCLVFLEHQYEDLRSKTPKDKMTDLLRKTWRKMSPKGHEEALKLNYSAEGKRLIQTALQGGNSS